jgi:hypothetical protein
MGSAIVRTSMRGRGPNSNQSSTIMIGTTWWKPMLLLVSCQPCGWCTFAKTVEYTMPVSVMPNSAARRTVRQTGPSRCGLRASWAEVTR